MGGRRGRQAAGSQAVARAYGLPPSPAQPRVERPSARAEHQHDEQQRAPEIVLAERRLEAFAEQHVRIGDDGQHVDGRESERRETASSRPTTSSAGKTSSPAVPATAASSGGSSGTWYSSWKRYSVLSQSETLSQPDFRNCQATYQRNARSSGVASHVVARSAKSLAACTVVAMLTSSLHPEDLHWLGSAAQ